MTVIAGRTARFGVAVRSRLALAFLLVPPLAWLGLAYLGSIAALLVTAFWTTNSFTGAVEPAFTVANFVEVVSNGLYWDVTVRTLGVALVVTVIDAVLAVPLALFMTKGVRSPAARIALVVAVTTPLWASYLVKAYAWRVLLAPNGPLSAATGGAVHGYGLPALIVTLTYMWLPYMVVPVYAAFERVPDSLIEASADLGARDLRTVGRIVLPLVFPGIAAGSIFTFSLTLGDYIAVSIVGGKTQLVANLIYGELVTANDQPLAAALSCIPLAILVLYLFALRRSPAIREA